MRMTSALIVLGFALAACSGGGEGDTAAEPEEAAAAADSMSEPMEKAEAVEETAMEHKEAVDDAVEAAEGDEDPPAEE